MLTRYTLKNITNTSVQVPDASLFELPEKVLQFGTGVLLRGLPDYFIDKANRQGIFNGRIVVVKSTAQGDSSAFEKQDGLYTLCIRGMENGQKVEENIINASISRVLNAAGQWEEILECAHNSNLQVIISNTTEVGIQLVHDDIRHHPPRSFPGKLLAFLYERFRAFEGSAHSGMVILPTELIPDNGKKLESIVLELAHLNGLEDAFIEWIENHNTFCNTLVDRIVPGKPEADLQSSLQVELGYTDSLITMSEAYRLWAIEGGDHVREVLSFAAADSQVIIDTNIDRYRELKLRMLNGTHTLSCGLAYLAGFTTVQAAMEDEQMAGFIADLMQYEIAPAIPYEVLPAVAHDFGNAVLDRFRNPYIRHQWINITMQYSSKMKMRCIPVLLKHYAQSQAVPKLFALGFAAYILFMRGLTRRNDQFYGELDGATYLIQDEQAAVFYRRWAGLSLPALVNETLQDPFWGTNLKNLPGFADAVIENLNSMQHHGVKESIETALTKKVFAA